VRFGSFKLPIPAVVGLSSRRSWFVGRGGKGGGVDSRDCCISPSLPWEIGSSMVMVGVPSWEPAVRVLGGKPLQPSPAALSTLS
jgi:hypothetical protein